MDISIRREEQTDYQRVADITRAAFSYPERIERSGIGCPYEHWMVHALREKDGIMELSYVAEHDGEVIGHIIYSRARVVTMDGKTILVLNLGPISLQPEYQRRGVGKALIFSTLSRAKELGYGAILFFGRPEYYPQFGFVQAERFGITDRNGENYPSFFAMELIQGYLDGVRGKYFESPIFDDSMNSDAAKDYDRLFRQVEIG